ncbi:MAG: beta-ketoacyl-ACP synthase III [candidate division WOR-3 bacterium]
MPIRIKSLSSYVPEGIVRNEDFEKFLDTSDEWITERTGIKERRVASPEEAASDMGAKAAMRAIERIGLDPKEIDLLIAATSSPDHLFPSTACLIQDKIGATRAAPFDISAGCPGFVFGLEIARGMLTSGNYKKALVIGTECLSRITDYTDRSTCVLFGDGAGAAVLEEDPNHEGIISSYLGGDGSLGSLLMMPAGGSRLPASEETIRKRLHYIRMEGQEVFRNAVRAMRDAALTTLKRAGVKPEEIDWLVPHQANTRIIEATRERLKLAPEKVYINIDRFGNTSAASIPIALDEMQEKGLLKEGQLVLAVAFGAGFVWGGVLFRW